MHNLLTKIMIY